jgi:hypothetical protein
MVSVLGRRKEKKTPPRDIVCLDQESSCAELIVVEAPIADMANWDVGA